MDIFIKNDPRNGIDGPNSKFWHWFSRKMAELHRQFPNVDAARTKRADGSMSEWLITGPNAGVKWFQDLAEQAARKIGYKGGPHGAVQFWLDEVRGDHVQLKSRKPRRDNERVAVVTRADGTKEGYRGKQKVAY